MNKLKPSRFITKEEEAFLMGLTSQDITLELLEKLFAYKEKSNPMFLPYDKFFLRTNKLYNDIRLQTTVGKYIFNLFILDTEEIGKLIGYQNVVLDEDGIGKITGKFALALQESKIDSKTYTDFLDKTQWLGFNLCRFLTPSMTLDLVKPPESVETLKQELISKYKDTIEKGDIIKFNEVEKKLLELSKAELKDCPDFEIYESGARGSFKNSYKNSTLLRGAIKNLADPSQFHISTKSLYEGIPPEEMSEYADLMTQASYMRAVGTREGGYESKKLSASLQNIVLDDPKTDCGSKRTRTVRITAKNVSNYNFRYIIENGKLKCLTPEIIGSYIGKTVQMRSPLYCCGDKYCNICSGEQYYLIGMKNVGLITNRIGTSLLNSSLKSFHDMSLKVIDVNIDDYIV